MLPSRAFLIALVLCLAAPSASAQEDDLLAPLTPSAGPKTKKTKAPKKPAKVVKAPKKGKKPGKEAKVEDPAGDELVAPLVEKKPELLVKLSGVTRGVRVLVDDKDVGAVSKSPIELEPGEHTLVVRKPGYREFSRRITATAGQVLEVPVQLEAMMGFVSVRSDVPGSRVFIDDEDRGVVPLDNIPLTVGPHEISVQQKGFRPDRQNITVRVGKEYTVDVNLRPERVEVAQDQPRVPVLTPAPPPPKPLPLTPEPATVASTPLTQRWYFWAGVGAVVIGAAVGTVVATQPLDSARVCGRTCDAVINDPRASAR